MKIIIIRSLLYLSVTVTTNTPSTCCNEHNWSTLIAVSVHACQQNKLTSLQKIGFGFIAHHIRLIQMWIFLCSRLLTPTHFCSVTLVSFAPEPWMHHLRGESMVLRNPAQPSFFSLYSWLSAIISAPHLTKQWLMGCNSKRLHHIWWGCCAVDIRNNFMVLCL